MVVDVVLDIALVAVDAVVVADVAVIVFCCCCCW